MSSPLPSDQPSSRGFSLLEILVVVAILAVLAALLFPVLQSARERANSVACLSNLRQLHVAMITMANDDGGQLPHAQVVATTATWAGYLLDGGYLPKPPRNRGKQPHHPLYDPGSKVMEGTLYYIGGYGINRQLAPSTRNQLERTRIVAVSNPSQKFLLFCSGLFIINRDQAANPSARFLYLPGRSANQSVGWSDLNRQDAIEGRHGRKINTITLAGNAEVWNADEIPLTSDRWDKIPK